MAAKQLLFHDEAHAKILAGIDTLAQAVRVTLGPKARTVVLERPFGAPAIINSGVVVARELELRDPFRKHGRANGAGRWPARPPTSPVTAPPPPWCSRTAS